jgi:hypothetical protein
MLCICLGLLYFFLPDKISSYRRGEKEWAYFDQFKIMNRKLIDLKNHLANGINFVEIDAG